MRGLATEAATVDNLVAKLNMLIPELLDLNELKSPVGMEIPFDLVAHATHVTHAA